MNFKQRILKLAYPLLMRLSRRSPRHGLVLENKEKKVPPQSVYGLNVVLNSGTVLPMQQLAGKKLLLVNTASECGYTGQYTELQQLAERHGGTLEVIGFPANDFKDQEKGSDADIAQFCTRNFGVQFPLAKKSSVVPGGGQHPVFSWLTSPEKNGWNNRLPDWNFSKYLLDEKGVLTHYFGPAVSPLGTEMAEALGGKQQGGNPEEKV